MPNHSKTDNRQLANIDADIAFTFDRSHPFKHDLATGFEECIAAQLGFVQPNEKSNEAGGGCFADI